MYRLWAIGTLFKENPMISIQGNKTLIVMMLNWLVLGIRHIVLDVMKCGDGKIVAQRLVSLTT